MQEKIENLLLKECKVFHEARCLGELLITCVQIASRGLDGTMSRNLLNPVNIRSLPRKVREVSMSQGMSWEFDSTFFAYFSYSMPYQGIRIRGESRPLMFT